MIFYIWLEILVVGHLAKSLGRVDLWKNRSVNTLHDRTLMNDHDGEIVNEAGKRLSQ